MGRTKIPRFVDDIRQFPKIMTSGQVAAYLQFTDKTVRNLAAAGEIPGTRVGGQWRFLRDDIAEIVPAKSSVGCQTA